MIKITRRQFASALAATAALPAVLGSGRALAADKRIRHFWWGNPERDRRTFEVIKLFMEKNPGTVVDGETISWSDYWPKMATQTAGSNMADVIQQDYRYLFEYARRGAIRPLNDFVGKDLDLSDFNQFSLDGGTVDGKLYGLNIGTNSQVIYVDLNVLKETGVSFDFFSWTWDDMKRVCLEIAKATPEGFYGCDDMGGDEASQDVFMRQRGKALYLDDGTIAYDQKDMEDWFGFWDDMRRTGACQAAELTAKGIGIKDSGVIARTSAMSRRWSNQVVAVQGLTDHEIVMSSYPQDKSGKPGQYYKPGQFISLTRDAQDVELAVKYINFFIRDKAATRVLGIERGVPASAAVRKDLMSVLTPTEAKSIQYLDDISQRVGPLPPPPPKGAGEIQKLLQRVHEQLVFEKMTVAEAAARFMNDAQKIRRKNG